MFSLVVGSFFSFRFVSFFFFFFNVLYTLYTSLTFTSTLLERRPPAQFVTVCAYTVCVSACVTYVYIRESTQHYTRAYDCGCSRKNLLGPESRFVLHHHYIIREYVTKRIKLTEIYYCVVHILHPIYSHTRNTYIYIRYYYIRIYGLHDNRRRWRTGFEKLDMTFYFRTERPGGRVFMEATLN